MLNFEIVKKITDKAYNNKKQIINTIVFAVGLNSVLGITKHIRKQKQIRKRQKDNWDNFEETKAIFEQRNLEINNDLN